MAATSTFEQAVADMRRLQKAYLRTRCSLTLAAAKKAEKEVDDALASLFPTLPKTKQADSYPKLFPDD